MQDCVHRGELAGDYKVMDCGDCNDVADKDQVVDNYLKGIRLISPWAAYIPAEGGSLMEGLAAYDRKARQTVAPVFYVVRSC